MSYTIKDTAEGVRVTLEGADVTDPAAWAIMLAGAATNRDKGAWTVKSKDLAEVTAALDVWIAGGRPSAGIAAGGHGPFTIGHADGRYTVQSAKSFAPALKRLGGQWDAGNTRWVIGAGKEQDLQALISKSMKAAASAAEDAWPEIKGLTITVREDGTVGLAFAYDDALKGAIKALPTARWDAADKQWTVSARYRAALRKKLVELAGGFESAKEVVDQRAADLTAKIQSVNVAVIRRDNLGWGVEFPYDAEVVSICRAAGLRWNQRAWAGKIGLVAQERLVEELLDLQTRRAAAPKVEAKPSVNRHFARAEPVASERFTYEFEGRMSVGMARRRDDGKVTIVSDISKAFRGFEDIGSLGGHPSMEDEWVVRVYWRDATPEEFEILEAQVQS